MSEEQSQYESEEGSYEEEYEEGDSEGEEEDLYEYEDEGRDAYDVYDGAQNEQQDQNNQALSMRWSLGFNYKLIDGAINLTRTEGDFKGDSGKPITEIFYVVGHTGVIYDYVDRKQRLLQGHCNAITSVAYSHSKRVIITADKGPSSLLVVWDVNTGMPKKCIFDPHPNGVQSLDITEDGSTIVTISREDIDPKTKCFYQQTVCVWDWEQEGNQLISTGILQSDPPGSPIDYQNCVQFNYKKPDEFATTGRNSVRFWKMEADGICSSYSPPTSNDGSNSKHFTQTVFIPNSTQAVSGTEEGSLVVWDISLIMEEMSQPDQKREIKTINLMNANSRNEGEKVGISVLKASKVLLIVGATNGNVRFYDYQFRIVGWFEEETGLSEVTSISLSNVHFHYEQVLSKLEKDEHDFDYPDFIVVDKKAKIILMKAEQFKGVTEEEKQGEILIQSIVSPIVALSARPKSSVVAIACQDGNIYEWNYMLKDPRLKSIRNMKTFNGEEPTCLKYSPNGKYLVVSSNVRNVYVYIVNKKEWQKSILTISQKKEYVHGVEISFSHDSKAFGIMDDHSCVTLFKLDEEERMRNKERMAKDDEEWVFSGKLKSHFNEVNDICFGEILDANNSEKTSKFYSIGNDKMLYEYDVKNSRKNRLDVTAYHKVEQEAHPTACIWYPVNYLKEEVIMIASDDYKIKLWNVAKNICRQTLLGPTYGAPINKFIYLNIHDREEQDVPKYVAYTTKEKIVGIIKLPLDGNPNKHMGMIAHPDKISYATASSDGKYLFTSGADDIGTLNMWRLNYSALELQETQFGGAPADTYTTGPNGATTAVSKNPNPLDTYPNLLEGGKTGQIYRDLKNFFYYAQISSSTDNPTKAKKLDGKIPRDQIQNLMRALGYYPTKAEIENMQKEVLYSKLLEGGELVESLELETFVRLFVNHRPVYGLTMDMVKHALTTLVKDLNNKNLDNQLGGGKKKKKKQVQEQVVDELAGLTRGEFVKLLTNEGEKMDNEELEASLKVLLGEGNLDDILPEVIDSEFLIEKLLGFELDELPSGDADSEDIDGIDEDEFGESVAMN